MSGGGGSERRICNRAGISFSIASRSLQLSLDDTLSLDEIDELIVVLGSWKEKKRRRDEVALVAMGSASLGAKAQFRAFIKIKRCQMPGCVCFFVLSTTSRCHSLLLSILSALVVGRLSLSFASHPRSPLSPSFPSREIYGGHAVVTTRALLATVIPAIVAGQHTAWQARCKKPHRHFPGATGPEQASLCIHGASPCSSASSGISTKNFAV